jgi:hypothetical protein
MDTNKKIIGRNSKETWGFQVAVNENFGLSSVEELGARIA